MMDSSKGHNLNSLDILYQFIDQLGLTLTQVKALATVGSEMDWGISEYEENTVNEYWNVVLNLIEEAEEIKHSITNVIKNY